MHPNNNPFHSLVYTPSEQADAPISTIPPALPVDQPAPLLPTATADPVAFALVLAVLVGLLKK